MGAGVRGSRSDMRADRAKKNAVVEHGTDNATVLPLVPSAVSATQLHAYVDSALDRAGRVRIESQLQQWPLDKVKAASYRSINLKLRVLFGDAPPVMSGTLRELANRTIERFAANEGGPLLKRC